MSDVDQLVAAILTHASVTCEGKYGVQTILERFGVIRHQLENHRPPGDLASLGTEDIEKLLAKHKVSEPS
jgi:hypothetical protein